MLRLEDVVHLCCPVCRGTLRFWGAARGVRLHAGRLDCLACGATYEVTRGVAKLYLEANVQGPDRLLRRVYDGLPAVHDPLVRYAFPLTVGETEEVSRERYLRALRLEDVASERDRDAGPIRLLEIGAGTGSSVPLLRKRLQSGPTVEVWAVDLSLGMLRLLEERMRFVGDGETHFFATDAHALPFADGFFDRVFHVGAINGYRSPATALAEMARVARPGTPIVVVDERLDPERRHSILQRLFFRWMTFYDRDPHAPVEHLPREAVDVKVEQMGRFFYCMTFAMPSPKTVRHGRAPAAGRATLTTGETPPESPPA
jgi:SAM-dependent methyltransferase